MSAAERPGPARVPGRAVAMMKNAPAATAAANAPADDAPTPAQVAAAAAVAYASWFEVSVRHAAADLADAAPNDRAMLRWQRLGRAICVAIRRGDLR